MTRPPPPDDAAEVADGAAAGPRGPLSRLLLDGGPATDVPPHGLACAATPSPGLDPMALLRAAAGGPRGFWQAGGRWAAWAGAVAQARVRGGRGDAADPAAAAGSGGRPGDALHGPAAAALAAVRRTADAVREGGWISGGEEAARPPRLFGGAAFEPGRRGAEHPAWAAFPAAAFVLPALTLEGAGATARLRLCRRLEPGSDPAAGLGRARERLDAVAAALFRADGAPGREASAGTEGPGPVSGPGVEAVRPATERRAWRRAVRDVLHAVRGGRVEKVVLARSVAVVLRDAADPVAVLERLRARDPSAWLFLVEPEPGRAFVGASPELLCSLRRGEVHAMAVAGSRPRGGDPAADERLGRDLLESAKDRHEHDVGVREVRERLEGLGLRPRVDPSPRLLRLAGIQHLRTDLRAEAGPHGHHALELAAALHPTAAVGGRPREAALRVLREAEPAGRGWYAGPVGWFDLAGDGAFTPGLRSVLIRGRELRLTAGAGIVAGSDADREWEEVRVKLRTVLDAVGVDATPAAP